MAAEPKHPRRSATFERRLLKSRSVLLFGEINTQATQRLITELLILNEIDRKKPIRMYVNNYGGVMDFGFAIYDVMRFIDAPVHTICTGVAASAATIVMVGGEKGHRFILPNGRMMLHQPRIMGTSWAQATDLAIAAKEILRQREKANEVYARETGQPVEKIAKDIQRDYWLSAEDAVAYRLVDRIVMSEKEIA